MTKEVIWCNKATQGNIKRGFIPIYFSCHDMHINAPSLFFNQKWLTPARTTTSHCSPGGASRIFGRGEPLAKWQTHPCLRKMDWKSYPYLGISWEIRPMSIQNMKKNCCLEVQFMRFYGFGNDNSHIFVHVEGNSWVFGSLLHSSTKKIPFATDYLRKKIPFSTDPRLKKVPVSAAHPY